MCWNCRLKYPRGMSIVTCILLYVALIGLLIAFFQPAWIVIPNETKYDCMNPNRNTTRVLTTTDKGSCGFSGMCYPMDHVEKEENMTCYPNMQEEKCIWYDSLGKIGNVYDQVCTLLFLVGLVLCVIAWFFTMIGCCSLTCCCCNLYTFIAITLTAGAMAILVGVLLWLGMMGGYDRFDQSCANVFCKDLGPFNLGSCQIGWSGYLGFASWLLLVISCFVTSCTANHYGKIIEEEKIPPKNLVNPYEKKGTLSQDNAFYFRENRSARENRSVRENRSARA